MTGQLINALGIRNGWVAMCSISTALAALLLPMLVLHLGGPLKARTRDEGSPEEKAEVSAQS